MNIMEDPKKDLSDWRIKIANESLNPGTLLDACGDDVQLALRLKTDQRALFRLVKRRRQQQRVFRPQSSTVRH